MGFLRCEICGWVNKLNKYKSLSNHLRYCLKDMSYEEYYLKYINPDIDIVCPICKINNKKFISIKLGYTKTCINKSCKGKWANLICDKDKHSKNIKKGLKNIDYKKIKKNRHDTLSANNNAGYKKIQEKRKYNMNQIQENGKTKFQNAAIKAGQTSKNTILSDGKSLSQHTAIKALNTYNSSGKRKIIQNKKKKIFVDEMLNILKEKKFKLLSEYNNAHDTIKLQCLKCNHIFETIWNYVQSYKKCPNCEEKIKSKQQLEVYNYIISLGISPDEIIYNDRTVLYPEELDIYIPSKKLAIEYGNLYHHGELSGCPKYKHYNKTKECSKQKINLITIFEDEWIGQNDIVKSILRIKINSNSCEKIYGRNCKIKEFPHNNTVEDKLRTNFLKENHLQGTGSSTITFGLFYKEQLVSVMSFNLFKRNKNQNQINKNIFELIRFCVLKNTNIIGGPEKLLKHFENKYNPKKVITYCDLRWSVGKVYRRLGFKFIKEVENLNYWYAGSGIKGKITFDELKNKEVIVEGRKGRLSERKRKDEDDEYPEHLLRLAEGKYRVYGCGNLMYEKYY